MNLEPYMGACYPNDSCFCDVNMVRNVNKICIDRSKCPDGQPGNKTCGEHERYTDCINPCNTPKGTKCLVKCIAGCICEDGYTKKNGTCVPTSPPKCGKNEEYNSCGTACPDTCDNYKNTCKFCTKQCVPGCFCKEGFVRDLNGSQCIEPKKCPKPVCNKPHEHHEWRPPTCPPGDGCNLIWSRFDCTNASKCYTAACRCDPGYYRNNDGICTTAENCQSPGQCAENAHYNDCINCPPNAQCLVPCKGGCECDKGYKEDENKVCVKIDTKPDCGKHAHYDMCPPTNCPPGMACPAVCRPACVCDPGYTYSNDYCGCVKDKPPPKCGKNKEYNNCGTACPETCDNYKNTCRACTDQCVPGCFCKKGLVLDANGHCIKPNKCPKRVCNKPHEHYDWCPANCPGGDGCNLLWSKFNCTGVPKCCAPACRCDPGYYRNKDGICVTAKQCQAIGQCAENSYYDDCTGDCICVKGYEKDENNVCVEEQIDYSDMCGPHSYYLDCEDCDYDNCESGCVCEDGYEWNEDEKECTLECGKHSHYDKCPPINCKPGMACAEVCRPACVCDKGYKNKDGKCVKVDSHQCPKNEEYKKCGTACPKTCKNKDIKINCIDVCKEGCYCKGDLVRDEKGDCVDPSKCPPPACPANQTYVGCVVKCPTEYCPKSNGPVPQCLPQNPCPPGCRCKPGYLINNHDDQRCILKEDCPPPVICRKNEHYEECGTACPATCNNPSPKVCTMQCVSGCFCDNGFVKNKDGVCVPKDQCPDTRCPKNEVYKSCGTPCPKTCENMNKNQPCSGTCKKGCYCIDDLVRNNNGTCVSPSECPLKCGKNEVATDCFFSCPSDYCRKPGDPVILCRPAPCPPYRLGCRCKDGYLRNDRKNNECIPAKHCPRCGNDGNGGYSYSSASASATATARN